MSRAEQAILTNMCMVYNDQGQILVQEKVNDDWTGICFPGGHIEPKESLVASVIREVKEETGLTISKPQLCGVKQFQTEADERYLVFLYKTNHFSGELVSSDEGRVFWIDADSLEDYQLAVSFKEMYRVFISDDLSEQYSYVDGDEVIRACY